MACLSVRMGVRSAGAMAAVIVAFVTQPCKAQIGSRSATSATRYERTDDETDSQDIVVPDSSRGLAVQSEADDRAEQAILSALSRPVSVNFNNAPLRDVQQAFQSRLGIPIVFDTKNLTDAGVTEDTTVTFSTSYLSARTALRHILGEKDLNWIIEGGAMVITTSDMAKTITVVRVYPIADLVMGADSDGSYAYDFDSLIELITSTIAPASWDSNGGAGSIAPYPESGALVFSQTRDIHEEIADLLDKLRFVRHIQGLDVGLKISRQRLDDVGSYAEQDTSADPQTGDFAAPQPAASPAAAQPRWRIPHTYH